MAVKNNMHIHVKVFEVTEFNSEVRSDLRGYCYAPLYLTVFTPSLQAFVVVDLILYSRCVCLEICAHMGIELFRDQLYKNRSSRKIDSRRLFSRE